MQYKYELRILSFKYLTIVLPFITLPTEIMTRTINLPQNE